MFPANRRHPSVTRLTRTGATWDRRDRDSPNTRCQEKLGQFALSNSCFWGKDWYYFHVWAFLQTVVSYILEPRDLREIVQIEDARKSLADFLNQNYTRQMLFRKQKKNYFFADFGVTRTWATWSEKQCKYKKSSRGQFAKSNTHVQDALKEKKN